MNILILGSSGQIGAPLCDYLEQQGHQVKEWDYVIDPKFDLRKKSTLLNHYIYDVDKIIFLAFDVGGSSYLRTRDKTYEYINNNILIMKNVFSVLKDYKKDFLFASSQMSSMDHSNYGLLKRLGEQYTKSLGGWICRFWNVYGYEDPNSNKAHVITDFITKALNNNIILRTTGKEERQFLHVNDCCAAIETWVNNKWDDKSKYYDITSFEWSSISYIARIIQSYYHCNISFGLLEDDIQKNIKIEPDDYIKKFWIPKIDLQTGILDIIKNYKV